MLSDNSLAKTEVVAQHLHCGLPWPGYKVHWVQNYRASGSAISLANTAIAKEIQTLNILYLKTCIDKFFCKEL